MGRLQVPKCCSRKSASASGPIPSWASSGRAGAGKSTLLNCLAGYRPPDLGSVRFDGHDAYERPDACRQVLGHVPQDDVVYLSLSVRENLAYAARLRLGSRLGKVEIAGVINEALGLVDLAEHADKSVAVLSGGQRKRLSVAIELLRRPPTFAARRANLGARPG